MKTKHTSKFFALLLAILMVVAILPFSAITVFADATGDAPTEVATFAELVAAVNEDKTNIKLMADITHTVPMELPDQHRLVFDGNKEYVLDLNGYNLSVQNRDNEYFSGTISFIKVMGTSKLTVKNGFVGFGNNKAKSREDYGSVQVTDSAELITENVAFESYKAGCTIILEKQAKATLNGGSVQAMNGYAVYAYGTSALTLDYGVTLRTTVGDGSHTVNNFGYGSLYFSSSGDLTVYGAYFKSGVQVHPTQIDEFDVTKKEVKIDGTKLTKKIYDGDGLPSASEYDYSWYRGSPTGYAIFTTVNPRKFVLEISVMDTERKFPITVTNGVAKVGDVTVTEAKYGETVTLEANAPESGYEFTYWSGDYSFADNSSATTTFVMPYGNVVTSANYGKEKIHNIDVILPAPQVGEPLYDTITSVSGKSEFVSIRWYLVNGGSTTPLIGGELFAAGNTYKVVVEFSPANGWLFDSNPAATVNGNTASASSSMPSVASVSYTFASLSSSFPVYYTDDFTVGFGSTKTVDVEKMANENTSFRAAYLDDKVTYQWYKNGEAIEGATDVSYKITSANNGDKFQVKVIADGVVSCGSARMFNEKLIGDIGLTMDDPQVGQKSSDFIPQFVSAGFTIAEEDGLSWQKDAGGYWTIINKDFIFEPGVKYRLMVDIIPPEGYSFVSPTVSADGRTTSAIDYGTLARGWITFDATPSNPFSIIMTADSGVGLGDTLELDIEAMKAASTDFKTAYEANKVSYQWYVDGTEIDGAKLSKFALGTDYAKKTIQVVVTADDKVACSQEFVGSQYIESLDILISPPIAGQTPSTTAIEKNGKVIIEAGAIIWYNAADDSKVTGPFVAGESYYVSICFTAAEGYVFDDYSVTTNDYHSSLLANTNINGVNVDKIYDCSYIIPNFGDVYSIAFVCVEHTHTYTNSVLQKDDTNHWLECDANDCPDKFGSRKDITPHSGGTATCLAQAVCSCGQSYGALGAHTFGEWQNEVAATCVATGTKAHKTCSTCHKHFQADGVTEITDLTIAVDTNNHDMATEWTKTAEGHYHVCKRTGCEYHDTLVAHTSSGSATETTPETCTVCGYVITPALGHTTHTPKTEWKSDADNHWHECTGCEGQQLEKAAHADSNNDGKCDTCEYQMSTTPNTPDDPGTTPPANNPPTDDDGGLGAGAIVGIVIGSVAVVGVGGFALFWFVIKKKTWAEFIALFKKH